MVFPRVFQCSSRGCGQWNWCLPSGPPRALCPWVCETGVCPLAHLVHCVPGSVKLVFALWPTSCIVSLGQWNWCLPILDIPPYDFYLALIRKWPVWSGKVTVGNWFQIFWRTLLHVSSYHDMVFSNIHPERHWDIYRYISIKVLAEIVYFTILRLFLDPRGRVTCSKMYISVEMWIILKWICVFRV
jgi:hypothetical protein